MDTSTRKKAEAVVTTPNLNKLHSDAAAYMKASRGLKLDFAVQKEEASHQIQALCELNDAARSAWESEGSSSKQPSTSCRASQPTTPPAATAAPEEDDGFEDIDATAQQPPPLPETEHSFADDEEEEEGAASPSTRALGFDPRGGRAATEGYEVIAEALVRAADGFGVAIGRAAVLGAADQDCCVITGLSGRAAASSLRVGDRIVAIDGEEMRSYQAAVAGLQAAPGDVLLTVERSTAEEAREAEGPREAEEPKEVRRRGLRQVALGVRAAAQMKSSPASEQGSPRKGGSSFLRSKSAAASFAKLEANSPGRGSSMRGLKKLDPLNVSGRLGGQFDKVSERLDKVGDRVNERLDKVSDNLDKVNLKRLDPLNVSGKLGDQFDKVSEKLDKVNLKRLDPLNVSGKMGEQLDRVSEKLDKVNLKKLDPLNVSGKMGEQLDRLDGKLEKMRPSAKRAAGLEAPAAAPEPAPPQQPLDPQLELLDMDI